MADSQYEVVFRGRVLKGHDVAVVKQNLARLFNVDAATAEKLFSGRRVSVKKGLDEATAKKYREALRKAGANASIVTVKSAPAPVPEDPASVPAATAHQQSSDGQSVSEPEYSDLEGSVHAASPEAQWSLDPLGTLMAEASEQPEPDIDIADLTVAEVGEVFDKPVAHELPEFDFSGLVVDEPGETIVTAQVVPAVEIDLSAYSTGQPGEVLPQPDRVAAPEFDLSGLNIAEAGIQLVKVEPVAPARIDTEHLELESEEPPPPAGNPFLQDE